LSAMQSWRWEHHCQSTARVGERERERESRRAKGSNGIEWGCHRKNEERKGKKKKKTTTKKKKKKKWTAACVCVCVWVFVGECHRSSFVEGLPSSFASVCLSIYLCVCVCGVCEEERDRRDLFFASRQEGERDGCGVILFFVFSPLLRTQAGREEGI